MTWSSAPRCWKPRAWPACPARPSASRVRCAFPTPARRPSCNPAWTVSPNFSPNCRQSVPAGAHPVRDAPVAKGIAHRALPHENEHPQKESSSMKAPVRVAVTGAAGQIGYALPFRIAAGDMLGPGQPAILHLLEMTPALPALQGVVMELNDCAFPTLAGVVATDDANVAFKDVDYALLVGARP